jgi:tryptophan synthase alpha subunit
MSLSAVSDYKTSQRSKSPVVMGYLNPVLQYGMENLPRCASVIDGVILRSADEIFENNSFDNGSKFIL